MSKSLEIACQTLGLGSHKDFLRCLPLTNISCLGRAFISRQHFARVNTSRHNKCLVTCDCSPADSQHEAHHRIRQAWIPSQRNLKSKNKFSIDNNEPDLTFQLLVYCIGS